MTVPTGSRPPAGSLVQVILEDRELVAAVRQLEPGILVDLVRHVGLEESGDLLALASPDQLRALADDDLWSADTAGHDQLLDPDRFAVWVEVLLESGPGPGTDALLALDEELLAHALAQQLLVLDLDQLTPALASGFSPDGFGDPELAEKLLESSLSHEIDELLLLSLRYHGWNAIIELLHEIDRRDHALLRRLLDRIRDASMNRVADDGLQTVLSDAERLAEDATAGRDDRREQRGFVAPADARAFLALARERPQDAGDDPVTRSYFRSYQPSPMTPTSAPLSRLQQMLRERGLAAQTPMLSDAATDSSPVRSALAILRDTDPALHGRLVRELIYLANVLIAGAPTCARPMARVEAVEAALSFADAGWANTPSLARGLLPLFAIGWGQAPAP